MNHGIPFALLTNGAAHPWADLPEWPVTEWARAVGVELDRGGRLSSLFGVAEGGGVRLVAVIAFDAGNTLAVGRSQPFSGSYPSLTVNYPQAHLFERELWEQHQVVPEGHPWLKPVRRGDQSGPAAGPFFQIGRASCRERV